MSDHINSSKIQSVDIEAQNYTINGEDIGKGILPKLVHRVSLHPMYDEETDSIVENQYFTLHNDAGDLLYTSKFIQGDSSFQTVITRPGDDPGGDTPGGDEPGGDEPDDPPIPPPPVPPGPWPPRPWPIPDGVPVPTPDDDEDPWIWLPPVIPSGPWGPSRPRRRRSGTPRTTRVTPKTKPPVEKDEDEDPYIRYIDGKYKNKAIEVIPSKDQRDWDNLKVYSAQMTFESTHIKYNNHPWPYLKKGNRMFRNCSRLRHLQGKTRFMRLREADQMFENCGQLLGFIIPEGSSLYGEYGDRFDFSRLKTAKRMFANCPQMTDVKFYLPRLQNASFMFLNNENLGVVDIDYEGNIPRCTTAVSMYEGTANLKHITPKSVFQNSLITADSMFRSSAIPAMPVDTMPAVTSAKYMFYACDALTEQIACFPSLENGNSMYQLCSNLTSLIGNAAKFPSLITGRRMFRDANKLALKKGGNKSGVNEFYFPVLVDGLSLFQNCNQVEVIPCNFPRLRNARQMFLNCNISGHLELDFPTQFPNVGYDSSIDGGTYPTAYMFGSCPITSIGFDFSTLDNGISMFNSCTQLTTCTKAVFMNGGNYQSMFSESKFNEASADIIIAAAKAANVQALHIGMDSQFRTDSFKAKHGCAQLEQGYDDQWTVAGTNIVIKWN